MLASTPLPVRYLLPRAARPSQQAATRIRWASAIAQPQARPPRSYECFATKGIASSGAARTTAWANFRIRSLSQLSVAADRGEQPRGVGRFAWLRLSDSSSAAARSDERRRRCFARRPSTPVAGIPLLHMGDSSSQGDRGRGARGPQSYIGTSREPRSKRRCSSRGGEALHGEATGSGGPLRLYESHKSAIGQHKRTALPGMTSASGRRRSTRSVAPWFRVSSDPEAWSVTNEQSSLFFTAWMGRQQGAWLPPDSVTATGRECWSIVRASSSGSDGDRRPRHSGFRPERPQCGQACAFSCRWRTRWTAGLPSPSGSLCCRGFAYRVCLLVSDSGRRSRLCCVVPRRDRRQSFRGRGTCSSCRLM